MRGEEVWDGLCESIGNSFSSDERADKKKGTGSC